MTTTKLLLVPIVICNKAFLTNSELKQHQDREAGNHKFKCEVCQVGFEEKRELHDYTVETKHTHVRIVEKHFGIRITYIGTVDYTRRLRLNIDVMFVMRSFRK